MGNIAPCDCPLQAAEIAMRFVSLVSDDSDSQLAVARLVEQAQAATSGKIDVVFAFLTPHHREYAPSIVEKLWLALDPQALIGCTAEGVIGGSREIERSCGLALLAGSMPDVRLHPFHVAADEWEELLSDSSALAERMGHGPQTRAVIGVADPFSTPVIQLMDRMDEQMSGSPLIGGMASGSRSPGANILLRNDEIFSDGMVGLSLSGNVSVQTIVSQGCRPIGRTLVITKAHNDVIEQLGGKPAMTVLAEMIAQLPEHDRHQIETGGLLLGRAISEYRDQFGRGDFLIRGLAGADQRSGAIRVGDLVRVGQTVQFHVHDAAAAHEDLAHLLDPGRIGSPPPAALLFSCNGRGTRLFEHSGHDIGLATDAMPGAAIAGFFAAGELGPVGGRNFIHGHTASFALLRPGA
jgi:small ligand-binding sensory domain FIST